MADGRASGLLGAGTAGPYLAARGLVDERAAPGVTELRSDGANVVLGVEAGGVRVVVKQARRLPDEEEPARRARVLAEAEALRLAARIRPGSVPPLLDVDADAGALVLGFAPPSWRGWDEAAAEADLDAARRLGEALGAWHRETEGDPELVERFGDRRIFERRALDPCHRAVMARWPRLREAIGGLVELMLDERRCLVHGALGPRHVLVGDGDLWTLDFQRAHAGDPVFDLASVLAGLMLAAIRTPAARAAIRDCGEAFLSAYGREAQAEYLLAHAGCLVLGAVDGETPAPGLEGPGRLQARALGARLVLDPPVSVEQGWEALDEALR